MNNDLTYGRNFADFLGSFWASIFDKGALGTAIGYASSEELIQKYLDMCDIIDSSSIYSIPVFSRKNVDPLIIKKSKFIDYKEYVNYGSGGYYGQQPQNSRYRQDSYLQYGEPATITYSYFCPIEFENISSLGIFALNRLFEPSVTLCRDSDFVMVEGGILFRDNIFENKLFPVKQTEDLETGEIDKEIVLWFCDVDIDTFNIYKQYGYTFTNFRASSNEYKEIVQTVFEIVSQGPSIFRIDAFLSAISGSPLIRETEETVQSITDAPEGKLVITDLNVYQTTKSIPINPSIKVGDILKSGTPLLDIVEVVDTRNPNWWKEFDVLPLEPGMTSNSKGFLGFMNTQLRGEYFTNKYSIDDTYKGVKFKLIGNEIDIKEFWESVSKKSVDNKITYGYEFFKKYGPHSTDPLSDFRNSKPFVVNPAQIFASDLCNFIVLPIRVKVSRIIDVERFFRTINPLSINTPVHIVLMLFFDIEIGIEQFDLANTDSQDSIQSQDLKLIALEEYNDLPSPWGTDQNQPPILEAVSIGYGLYGGRYNFYASSLDSRGFLIEKIDLSSSSTLVQNIELKQIPKCAI